jgi:magnesium-transporting ATPase (P-type)
VTVAIFGCNVHFFQEAQVEMLLKQLNYPSKSKVSRNGELVEIRVKKLALGDFIQVEEGTLFGTAFNRMTLR